MKFRPNLIVAAIIAPIHFVFGFITAAFAAGQADSLGQPHGYGWIVAYYILVFPLSASDWLPRRFDLPGGLTLPAMFIQSVCWGIAVGSISSLRRHYHKPVA